jgi:hypothetical protein
MQFVDNRITGQGEKTYPPATEIVSAKGEVSMLQRPALGHTAAGLTLPRPTLCLLYPVAGRRAAWAWRAAVPTLWGQQEGQEARDRRLCARQAAEGGLHGQNVRRSGDWRWRWDRVVRTAGTARVTVADNDRLAMNSIQSYIQISKHGQLVV